MTNPTDRSRPLLGHRPASTHANTTTPNRVTRRPSSRPLRAGHPKLHRLGALTWVALAACLVGCGPLGLEQANDATDTNDASVEEVRVPGGDEVALVLEGREITLAELHRHMQAQFMRELLERPEDELYEMRENAVRDIVQRHVIDSAAAERGVTPEALFEDVTGNVPAPTVQDVTDWYQQNQSRLRGARLEDVAPQIQDMLANERRGQAWTAFVEPKLNALEWEQVLEPPRKELAATRLIRGDHDAPVTIMSFSDYQCPYCIRSEPVLAEVLARYPGQVRLIHRHFPLDSIHPFARPASEASMCADEQGKFWEYHDAIFAQSGRIEQDTLADIGQEIGLDGEAFEQCVSERRYADFVQADFQAGQDAGVTGTPAFFVNGIPLKGARDADSLSRVVDTELERIQAN